MIQKVRLNGFKSFDDTSIELKELTLLTGLNSSGKSSVIQAIEMAETFRSTNGRTFLLSKHGNVKELTNESYNGFEIDVQSDNYSVYLDTDAGKSIFEGEMTDSIFYLEAGRNGGVNAIDTDRAAVGAVERADNLQQRGLAGSRRANDADNLSTVYVEVNTFQYL